MELLKDENPAENPEIRAFLNDVKIKEAEAFNRIFLRFCLMNGIPQDISKIETREFAGRPNYWEYYFLGKIPKHSGQLHFLMSRELKMVEGEFLPVLRIAFNKDLIDEPDN